MNYNSSQRMMWDVGNSINLSTDQFFSFKGGCPWNKTSKRSKTLFWFRGKVREKIPLLGLDYIF